MKKMTLKIRHFGPINKAEIDIGKINVIAGNNATSKSTTSKLLYCFLAAVSSEGEYLADRGIKQRLSPLLLNLRFFIMEEYPDESMELLDLSADLNDIQTMYNRPGTSVKEIFKKTMDILKKLEFKNKESILKDFGQIEELISLQNNPEDIHESIMNTLLNIEFGGGDQIINNFNDSSIKFSGVCDNCEFWQTIKTESTSSKGETSDDYLRCVKVNEISYIETPYIFDYILSLDYDLPNRVSNYHQKLLMRKLRDTSSQEDIYDKTANKNIIKFQEKINEIIQGKFIFDSSSKDFNFQQGNNTFTMKNTSAGLKQLGIIQLLLENRKLSENSYLIMDEPEVHLHPEWQVKLAEIIVLMAKDLNITSYINSHSPHFIEAIEVYSEWYELEQDTNFYLTKEADDNKFDINKIDRMDLSEIYDSLGEPYRTIDKIRGQIDAREVINGRD